MLNLGDQTPAGARRGARPGQAIGSRVMIASPPEDAWGETGNSQLGIGNTDTVVFVVDLVGTLPEGPEGTEREPAAWAPTIVAEGRRAELARLHRRRQAHRRPRGHHADRGRGRRRSPKGQTVYVNYLGQVPGAEKPFDESYSSGQPFSFTVGSGQVIEGWDRPARASRSAAG